VLDRLCQLALRLWTNQPLPEFWESKKIEAELQSWSVDVESGRATLVNDHRDQKRWLGGPRNTPVKVGAFAVVGQFQFPQARFSIPCVA
jgi:hypothetical protein